MHLFLIIISSVAILVRIKVSQAKVKDQSDRITETTMQFGFKAITKGPTVFGNVSIGLGVSQNNNTPMWWLSTNGRYLFSITLCTLHNSVRDITWSSERTNHLCKVSHSSIQVIWHHLSKWIVDIQVRFEKHLCRRNIFSLSQVPTLADFPWKL